MHSTATEIERPTMRPAAATRPFALIVEDEAALVELIRYNLVKEGYEVAIATDGEDALLQIAERQPDIVLLDWMLPKLAGIEVARRLRSAQATRNLPIIMLTARTEESDRIRGLDIGADDYMTKPFSMSELTARIRAVMRRIRPALADDIVVVGDISMDRAAHKITHPGRVFSREQLLDAVWGSDVYVETRTVDVHIGRLRKALSKGGGDDPIRTVRSAGYALNV